MHEDRNRMNVLSRLWAAITSVKLAIFLFAGISIMLAAGTIVEARSGTEVALQTIYRGPLMTILTGLLLLNEIAIILHRWPYKPHQIGWVLAHIGVLIILVGSIFGRRGQLEGQIVLQEGQQTDEFVMQVLEDGEHVRYAVPLGFTVALDSFEVRTYPGTQMASDYRSSVVVHDEKRNRTYRQTIRVNAPLILHGFVISQNSYVPGTPASSVFGVLRNPGTPSIFVGFTVMSLGLVFIIFVKAAMKKRWPPNETKPFGKPIPYLGRFSSKKLVSLLLPLLLFAFPVTLRAQTAEPDSAATQTIESTQEQPLSPDQISGESLKLLQELPILYGGRVRPFVSFASDVVREVTGKSRWDGQHPSATVLQWIAMPEWAYEAPLIPVPYEPLRKATGLPGDEKSRYSMRYLVNNQQLRSLALEALDAQDSGIELTMNQNKVLDVMGRLGALQDVLTHEGLKFIPNTQNPSAGWLPPQALVGDSSESAYRVALSYTGLIEAYRHGNLEIVNTALRQLSQDLAEWHGGDADASRLGIEVFYRRAHLWTWARGLYLITLLAMLLSVLVKQELFTKVARSTLLLGFLVHTAGLLLRWYIGGRAPWSNMYESLITATWGLLLIAQFSLAGKAGRIVIPVAALIAFANLTIASHPSLSPAIDPLVPALQSVWLNIHVIVILLGYASGTLAMGAGHAWIFYDTFRPDERALKMSIAQALYRFMEYAVLFLIVGILLGSVWANSAWGRYWGWDPKETWALITWFYYLSLVHAQKKGYIRERGLAIASLFGFLLVLVTYYGVNYYLAGLHSYAKGESVGLPLPVVLFVLAEAIILIGYGAITWRRKALA